MADGARQRRARVEARPASPRRAAARAHRAAARDGAPLATSRRSGRTSSRAACANAPRWPASLAQDAEVLLMDEPFGALDAMTRDVLHDELEALWRTTGKTVMFVTHNVREAIRLGDRVVLLDEPAGPRRRRSRRRRSNARAASTRPRSRPSRRRSPTTSAMRWSVMPAGSETLHPVEDLDIAAFEDAVRPRADRTARKIWAATWPKLLAVAFFVGAWQIVVWPDWKDEFVLPSPFTVFDQFWQDTRTTLARPTRDDAARERSRATRSRSCHRRRGRVARLAVEDPALRRSAR